MTNSTGPHALPLDADIQAFIAENDLDYPPDAADRPIAEQRAFYNAMCERFRAPRPEGIAVHDGAISGAAGDVPVRSYRPLGHGGDARILYFHGGGYFLGGLDSHDDVCAELAEAAALELVAADYRLAPEHPFPAPYEDALAVAQALALEGVPLILAGDSVGATLAAAVALGMSSPRSAGAPLKGLLLIYPSLSAGRRDLPSFTENASAPLFTSDYALWAAKLHAGEADPDALSADPRFAPLSASEAAVAALPPCLSFAVDIDPVRDDASAWTAKLTAAGAAAASSVHSGLPHGALRARHRSLKAAMFFRAIQEGLRHLRNI